MMIAMIAASIASSLVPGPPLSAAKSYVIAIYRKIPGDFDYRSVRYAPELASLIQRDDICGATGGGICLIEAVPFCECQDTDPNYRILNSRVTSLGAGRASVVVTLRNGSIQRFTVDMRWGGGGWRVADIHGPKIPSLRNHMVRWLPKEEANARMMRKTDR